MLTSLKQLNIMVTRPSPQGVSLCEMLRQQGANPIFFPAVEIASLTESSAFIDSIRQLHLFNWLIFISPQAVLQTAKCIHKYWPSFPKHVKIAALGEGTALTLQKAHLPVHIYPPHQWDSEGLLALQAFQHVSQQKIAFIRGEGGRTFLADELTKRGAVLSHIIAYRRCLPKIDVQPYLNLLNKKKIDIIISTSSDILQNLTLLLGNAGSELYRVRLIVISSRMMALAKKLGFHTILLAKNASHEAIMTILKDQIW